MKSLIEGAYDIHFHTAPDVVARKCTDSELARRWLSAGMKGGVIKGHFSDTSGRAAIIRQEYPFLEVFGGLTLNRQAGGINPVAVERMAQASGKFLWLPTLDSRSFQEFRRGENLPDNCGFLEIMDKQGILFPEMEQVLDVVLQYDLVLCTGHLSAREGMAVLFAAAKKGIKRMLVTHADNPANRYTIEQQKECVKLGAMIEHCYFTTYYGRSSWEQIVSEIDAVGAPNVCLSTDFGQIESPFSDEGIQTYAQGLKEHGISLQGLEQMLIKNPVNLIRNNR